MTTVIPSLSDVKRAHQRIEKYINKTPILTSKSLNEITGASLYFKCENFQKVGAFKIRGAVNKIFRYRPEDRENGIATHSSGNHAQAVALAAKIAGTEAYVVMPDNSAEVKIRAVQEYGAKITFCPPGDESRKAACDKIINETGAIFIPPFEDPDIICGAATVAKEFIEDISGLDFLITPVGGGGLSAGTALAANFLDPNLKVILGEPEKADDTYRSFNSGKAQKVKNPETIADGLRVSVGELNFEIIREMVEDVVTVSEKEIVKAMRMIWERMKVIIEPSSAVAFAVVLKEKKRFKGKEVGIILTGGNVDLTKLPFN